MKRISFLLLLLGAFACLPLHAQTTNNFKRTEDVIYARKFGVALTMDVFQPDKPNGCAVIYMVSGGWYSSKEAINPSAYRPFLDRGYTVFAVVHGSQPKFTIPEVTADVHRAVRFIRHNAARWGVDPDKFGVSGGSAGGHLSLMLGTGAGKDWPATGAPQPGWRVPQQKKDAIDGESSAVQAVACFFPPTDFLNYGQPGEDAVGVGTLKDFKPAFGSRTDTPESTKLSYLPFDQGL
ncbi:MAG: alpha/beta hydrolase, partial [Verrucomicrobia bacterium]|nr:alpha/beta hydrolase [Verrucomicrobiota bacterium]